MDSFKYELLELICTTCNVQDVDLEQVRNDDPLIGPDSPLGIDSIDALEIAVTIQQQFGVRMDSENTSREVLQNLTTLSNHIKQHQAA